MKVKIKKTSKGAKLSLGGLHIANFQKLLPVSYSERLRVRL